MSVLSTEAIKERLGDPDLSRRLVLSPLLEEEAQLKPGQAAVDVRLGFDFCQVTASSFGSISEFEDANVQRKYFDRLYTRLYVPLGSKLVIHPHQFYLAQTLEYIRLPRDLMAYVVGRSTWGRLGLIIATAVGIHPGFAGVLTLELRNLGETPLSLYPGQTIAQLFLHEVAPGAGVQLAVEDVPQYSGSVDMIPRHISSRTTHEKIKKLIDRFELRSRL